MNPKLSCATNNEAQQTFLLFQLSCSHPVVPLVKEKVKVEHHTRKLGLDTHRNAIFAVLSNSCQKKCAEQSRIITDYLGN
jgi:hypothetical protein